MVAASGEALQYLLFARVAGHKERKQTFIDILRRQAATALRRRQGIERIGDARSAPIVGTWSRQ